MACTTKILLVRPRQSAEKAFPLELASVGAALRQHGFAVEAVDAMTDRNAAERILSSRSAGAVVFLSTTTVGVSTYPADWIHVESLARRIKRRLAARVVVGGAYATPHPGRCAACPWVDDIVTGEPEVALPALLADPSGGGARDPSPARLALDLDALPHPELALLDPRDYPAPIFAPSAPAVPIVTSRGCRHSCSYCRLIRSPT